MMTKTETLKRGFEGKLSFEEFSEFTGLIFGDIEVKSFLEEYKEELKECGLYDEIEDIGYIDANWKSMEKIKVFLEKTQHTFHVVTQCIEGETEYWENRMAVVNRMNFVLALGNNNGDVYFSEEYQKEFEKEQSKIKE
jgi:hypothetical protein